MVAEPAVAQAANRPFIPMDEGLGPEELYYCQVEAMLGTLLGRLLVMGLYCLLIAGWQGALLGMALLLVLGWRQILRHKDRPDLLRYNYHRFTWGLVLMLCTPMLLRLLYAALQAWAPGVLDAWLGFTAPIAEYLGQHLSTFAAMSKVHAVRFVATDQAQIPRLDLALHMQVLHWLSLPAVLLFVPLLMSIYRRVRPMPQKDRVRLALSFVGLECFAAFIWIMTIHHYSTTKPSKLMSMQFAMDSAFFIQLNFIFMSFGLLAPVYLFLSMRPKWSGAGAIHTFSRKYLRYKPA